MLSQYFEFRVLSLENAVEVRMQERPTIEIIQQIRWMARENCLCGLSRSIPRAILLDTLSWKIY